MNDFILLDCSFTLRNLSKDEKEAVKTLIALAVVEASSKIEEEIELPQSRLEILNYD